MNTTEDSCACQDQGHIENGIGNIKFNDLFKTCVHKGSVNLTIYNYSALIQSISKDDGPDCLVEL